jgi:hypothetical protein
MGQAGELKVRGMQIDRPASARTELALIERKPDVGEFGNNIRIAVAPSIPDFRSFAKLGQMLWIEHGLNAPPRAVPSTDRLLTLTKT